MKKRKEIIYVTQYGFWWSMSLETWLEICRIAAEGGEYNLDNHKGVRFLKGIPYHSMLSLNFADKDGMGSTWHHTPAREGVFKREPLDWTEKEYRQDLEEFARKEPQISR